MDKRFTPKTLRTEISIILLGCNTRQQFRDICFDLKNSNGQRKMEKTALKDGIKTAGRIAEEDNNPEIVFAAIRATTDLVSPYSIEAKLAVDHATKVAQMFVDQSRLTDAQEVAEWRQLAITAKSDTFMDDEVDQIFNKIDEAIDSQPKKNFYDLIAKFMDHGIGTSGSAEKIDPAKLKVK